MDELMESLLEELTESMEDGICNIDICDAGKIVDMIKDLAMAKYYCTVVKAMENGKSVPYVGN